MQIVRLKADISFANFTEHIMCSRQSIRMLLTTVLQRRITAPLWLLYVESQKMAIQKGTILTHSHIVHIEQFSDLLLVMSVLRIGEAEVY